MDLSDEDLLLIRAVLRKLYNLRVFGKKHKSLIRVARSVPSHLRGRAKEMIKFLIKKGILGVKPTLDGPHIFLLEFQREVIEKICKADSTEEVREIIKIL